MPPPRPTTPLHCQPAPHNRDFAIHGPSRLSAPANRGAHLGTLCGLDRPPGAENLAVVFR